MIESTDSWAAPRRSIQPLAAAASIRSWTQARVAGSRRASQGTSDRARVVPDMEQVRDFIAHYGEHRHDVEHEIDGVVVRVGTGASPKTIAAVIGALKGGS